jgi:hypothetical protein
MRPNIKNAATIVAMASEMGIAIHTPFIPNIEGITIRQGIKNNT